MSTRSKKSYKIDSLKKRFHRQWLLVAVNKVDNASTIPLSGYLLAHSPNRAEIYQLAMKTHGKKPLLIEYSEDKLPKGFAVAFFCA